jgi:hypothetical protein
MSKWQKLIVGWKLFFEIIGGWFGFMSGAISIPFAIATLQSPEGKAKIIFAALAYFCLVAMIVNLAWKNFPRFKLTCRKDIELCATPKIADVARYFRMRVVTNCINGIEQCCGNLEKIEKDGVLVFQGDATELPFSKPENRDTFYIHMKPDIDYWLDVLVVFIHRFTEEELRTFSICNDYTRTPLPIRPDNVFIATKQPYTPPNDINRQYIFRQAGEYILYVSVSGKGVPTAKAKLKFTWTGKANDSTIEMIQ